jgi:hypothetical protein
MRAPNRPDLPGLRPRLRERRRHTWLGDSTHRNAVRFVLDVVPYAGLAIQWFVGASFALRRAWTPRRAELVMSFALPTP